MNANKFKKFDEFINEPLTTVTLQQMMRSLPDGFTLKILRDGTVYPEAAPARIIVHVSTNNIIYKISKG